MLDPSDAIPRVQAALSGRSGLWAHAEDMEGDVEVGKWLGYQPTLFSSGPLHFDERVLREFETPLVVEGDLVVERDLVLEHYGTLLVMGDLQAGHLLTAGRLFVLGSLRSRLVLANNLGSTIVDKELATGLLIGTDEHLVTVFGNVRADVMVDIPGGCIEGRHSNKRGRDALHEDLTSLSIGYVRTRLANGEPLLA